MNRSRNRILLLNSGKLMRTINNLSIFKIILLVIIFFVSIQYSYTQEVISSDSNIQKFKIRSEILNEDLIFSVFVPETHYKSSVHYPLLVVLDGDDFFHTFTGMIEYYSKIGKCPELIIVGVNAADRWRDYTPTRADIPDGTPVPNSGGAAQFLTFIQDELIDFIGSKYRITPFHILYGHSIAGLFVINSLFENSSTFSAYMATSPSLWWDNELMKTKSRQYAKSIQDEPRYLYITMGNEGPTMLPPLLNLTTALDKSDSPNIIWKFDHFEKVDHQTMPIKAFIYGLEYIFNDWQMPQEYFEHGLNRILEYYGLLSKKYKNKIEVPESILNRLGYKELAKGEVESAIRIFELNVSKYPHSANVYDSLGEAFLAAGDSTNAILNYKKALELNPDNTNARKILAEISC